MTGSDEKRRVAFLLSLQEQEQGRQCTRPFHAIHPNDCRVWNGLAHKTNESPFCRAAQSSVFDTSGWPHEALHMNCTYCQQHN